MAYTISFTKQAIKDSSLWSVLSPYHSSYSHSMWVVR